MLRLINGGEHPPMSRPSGYAARRTLCFLLLRLVNLQRMEMWFQKRPNTHSSQAIATYQSGDRMGRVNVGSPDALERYDVAAVDVLPEAAQKWTFHRSHRGPIVFQPWKILFALTAVCVEGDY
jgi:hypothetical protein